MLRHRVCTSILTFRRNVLLSSCLLRLLSHPEDRSGSFPELNVNSTRLHGVTSRNTVIFIFTAWYHVAWWVMPVFQGYLLCPSSGWRIALLCGLGWRVLLGPGFSTGFRVGKRSCADFIVVAIATLLIFRSMFGEMQMGSETGLPLCLPVHPRPYRQTDTILRGPVKFIQRDI
jgi:hypothetical protein